MSIKKLITVKLGKWKKQQILYSITKNQTVGKQTFQNMNAHLSGIGRRTILLKITFVSYQANYKIKQIYEFTVTTSSLSFLIAWAYGP